MTRPLRRWWPLYAATALALATALSVLAHLGGTT